MRDEAAAMLGIGGEERTWSRSCYHSKNE